MLTQTLRSRFFALLVHASLWLILALTFFHISARIPPYRESNEFSIPASSPIPVGKFAQLFSPTNWPSVLPHTNDFNPFFTRHFVPPPTPAPPPPPTTKKIELTYRGFIQSPDKGRNVMLNVGSDLIVLALGQPVATNALVADASMQSLTLTNSVGETNVLLLNVKSQIEVPIK